MYLDEALAHIRAGKSRYPFAGRYPVWILMEVWFPINKYGSRNTPDARSIAIKTMG